MMAARRKSTNGLYQCYLKMWKVFCKKNHCDPVYCASVNVGLKFLQELFNERGSSAVATARSALSSVIILPDNQKFGKDPFVMQFMKGVHQLKPSCPRYINTWDPDVILSLFKTEDWNVDKLDLYHLSVKLVTLILLATFQRGQLIKALHMERMSIRGSDKIIFQLLPSDFKQGNRRKFKPDPVIFEAFHEEELCIVKHLFVYLSMTDDLRGSIKELFITSKPPYRAVSRDTVSKWVKKAMMFAKVDVDLFSPGSTRAASTTKALNAGLPLESILDRAGWSNQSTFFKWYYKG